MGLFEIRNTISGGFPIDNVIVGICMVLWIRSGSMVSFCHSTAVWANFCFDFCTIFCIADFDFAWFANKTIIFWLWRFPFSAIGASAALTNPIWLHYITIMMDCATYFVTIQIFFCKVAFVVHIPPGTAVIIHIDDITTHFGERGIVANDALRLDLPQHFVVASHEPLFLILPVIMFRCHVGRYCHGASLFNSLKTEIECGFIAPVDGWNDTDTLGCPVRTAPAVAEYIVDLHHRSHFQIHTEIRGKNGSVPGQLFNIIVRVLPDPLKAVIVQEEMHHPV